MGHGEKKVIASIAEGVKADSGDPKECGVCAPYLQAPPFQMVSFTITEKGYALKGADGTYFPIRSERY